ncbi:hypothetical protein SRABI84_04692 [Peribacillus simplex]|uniref:hypothetical protein n=1 Tax=Peribacillus simplex TaxID=1478 RepID=UPI001DC65568|nr:hypothetical protein SRABI84_04692 [Peribacillus simplex]
MEELDLPESVPYNRIWETTTDNPARKTAHIINEELFRVSILFPIPHSCPSNDHTQLFKTLQKGIDTNFNEIEVVVVGRIPAEIESFASRAPMGAIRWWPMEPNDSLETCIQYAKFCSSCTEKEVVLLEPLQG